MNIERYNIGKVAISKTNLNNTLEVIDRALQENKHGYICVTNSRTTYIANHDDKYCQVQNNSLLTVPDGMPLVWIAHNMGYKNVGRVSGPDLMNAILKVSTEKGYSHYFYGSAISTIEQMQLNIKMLFPNVIIKDAVSPPFQTLEKFDINSLAVELNELCPTFFWCGLGAPKQERFIALLQPKLKNTICIGVGLAFEYNSGTVLRAPVWMQVSGLEWFFRLSQQPKNMKRAILPFLWILLKLVLSFFKRNIFD